jgi:hypothetical protein
MYDSTVIQSHDPSLREVKTRLTERYRWRQRFWPLKCVNSVLGASHLPEVCWKEEKGRKQT